MNNLAWQVRRGVVRSGLIWPGTDWHSRRGEARSGVLGEAGNARFGAARLGVAMQRRQREVRRGDVRLGKAGQAIAGVDRSGIAKFDPALQARRDDARCGMARDGEDRQCNAGAGGMVRRDLARHRNAGTACCGVARSGWVLQAWLVCARRVQGGHCRQRKVR